MTPEDALNAIRQVLQNSFDDLDGEIELSTDLIEDNILDSLDAMKFIFDLEKSSGVSFPETDLEEDGFYKVENLVGYLTANAPA